jgi:hypothetical protein
MLPAEFRTGKAWWVVARHLRMDSMLAMDGIVTTSQTIMSITGFDLLGRGPSFLNIGIYFVRNARSYKLLVNNFDTALDTIIVTIMGKNMSIDSVVSNMINSSE